ncbi:MAG: hypothetical protein AAB365_00840 [Patescibacteria group bacterium]
MFFSRKNGTLTLILDVQSSIIRGTLVHMRSEGKPHVLFTHDVGIAYKPHARSGYIVKAALAAISETIRETLRYISHLKGIVGPEHDIPHHISDVHYVLSSPWIVSQAKTISQSFKKETSITRSYILGLIAEERKKLSEKGVEDIRVIEEKIFDVRLNGYSVASWESRSTKDLEVSFVSSVAGTRMIERFVEACDHIVGKGDVKFHSSLFLQHIGLGKVIPERANYALIHIHGELTDVAIVHAHSCTFFGSFPFGVHTIIRTMARELKISEQTADSALALFTQGTLDATHTKKEGLVIENMSSGWVGEFRKLLKTNPASSGIPHHVIISARSHEDFFSQCLKKEYSQLTLESLDIQQITAQVDYESLAERLRLTGLYIVAIHSMEK